MLTKIIQIIYGLFDIYTFYTIIKLCGAKGDLITLYSALDEFSEAEYVAEEIKKLVGSGKYQYKDIACFYRTNAQSRALEEALMTKKFYIEFMER